ncbi:MAG: hypothetical protein ABQ298_09040 [Puniceicoccaceae bacterium]
MMGSHVYSVEIPLEAQSFTPVTGGSEIFDGTQLYVSSFSEEVFSASNPTDVVIIEDMTALMLDEKDEDNDSDDVYVFVANYSGYNTSSEETAETGSLVFEIPVEENQFGSGTVKGFYRKTGPWQRRQTDQEFLLDGITGTLSYQSLKKSRDVDFVLNGTHEGEAFRITGTAISSVLSTEFLSMSSWQADEDSDFKFSFVNATLRRDGNTYTGFFNRSDTEEPNNWESLFAIYRVTDTNDSDGDGVPDLSDLGSDQILGVLSTHSIQTGSSSYWSNDLNTTVMVDAKQFWLFGENIGWFYLPDQNDATAIRVYLPDERLGWLTTHAEMSPSYIRESDGVEVRFDLLDGEIAFYDSELDAWFTLNY